MNEIIPKNYILILFAMIVLLFFSLHLVYLECDMANVGITSYFQIDELYYNNGAFNAYYYGNPIFKVVDFLPVDDVSTRIVPEFFTYIGLLIFGNNYYGLRMPSLFSATAIFCLMSMLLYGLFEKRIKGPDISDDDSIMPIASNASNNAELLMAVFLILYMMVDFAFLNASRINEPTIIRMLVLTAFIYAFSLMKPSSFRTDKTIFMLGLLATCSVFFVYIYNIFIYASIALLVFLMNFTKTRRIPFKAIFMFFLGTLAGIGLFISVSVVLFDQGIADYFSVMVPFSDRLVNGIADVSVLRVLVRNFTGIFITNFFRNNPVILFAFFIALPPFIYKTCKEKNVLDVFVALLLSFLFLQALVINDYLFRKLIIIMPLVIIVLFEAFVYHTDFAIYLKSNKRAYYIYRYYWLIFATFASLFFHLLSNWVPLLGTSLMLPSDINRINLTILMVFIILISRFFWNKQKKSLLIVSIIIILIPNAYMDYKYVYSNPTYHYMEIMCDIGNYTNDNIIAGGYAYGYRLYNTSVPVLDCYSYYYPMNEESKYSHENFRRLFKDGIATYSIAMASPLPSGEESHIDSARVGSEKVEAEDIGDITSPEYMEAMGMVLVKEYDSPGYTRVLLYKHN